MAFKSDKQRKAFFAKQGNPRSSTAPVIMKQTKFQKLKGFVAKEKEVLRQRRERKGFERIRKEKIALSKELATANRLREELETEQAREKVAMQRRATQAEFSRIKSERLERKLAPFKRAGIRILSGTRKAVKASKKIKF